MTDTDCYRVSVTRGDHTINPIIDASSKAEAREKATVLGLNLLGKRLPWLMENGRSRPTAGGDVGALVFVGEPALLHTRNRH